MTVGATRAKQARLASHVRAESIMPLNTPRRTYLLAAILAIGSMAALTMDMPLARLAANVGIPGDLRKLLSVSEVFAHGMGVGLILLTIAVLDPAHRRHLFRIAYCAYGAGLCAQLAKLVSPRLRPNVCDLETDALETFFFAGADRFAHLHQLAGRDVHAYPSGHSATAVGLALALAWLYPRGRWLFAGFATLAMAQRIESQAHFLSDTLGGAAIACVIAGLCWHWPPLNQFFRRLELSDGRAQACLGIMGRPLCRPASDRRAA